MDVLATDIGSRGVKDIQQARRTGTVDLVVGAVNAVLPFRGACSENSCEDEAFDGSRELENEEV